MSLKSFDKFCEDLILKEPGSDKIILDERQKIMQSKILTEALIIFSGLAFVNCLVMDLAYQWAETYAAPLLVFMLICACYFNIRCAATGSLVGINGERSVKFSAGYCVFMGIMMSIKYAFSREEEDRVLFADGKLTDNFCFLLVWILAITCGILTLIFIKKSRKEKEGDEQ
ncbi:MAG: hypothetical protein K2J77_10245 [Oscillospiraceae bacterium]|nr:hypothetical protein [Oscillospiraceae bacterium]